MDFKPIIESVFKDANENTENVFNVRYEELIEEICKRVWNKAIEVAADNAEADHTILSEEAEYLFGQMLSGQDYEVYVLKQSILRHKL